MKQVQNTLVKTEFFKVNHEEGCRFSTGVQSSWTIVKW